MTENENKVNSKSLCDSCVNDSCIFQSGIVRKNCDFYKSGRWIEERTYMECPNCHDIWHYEKNQTERFKFCPTCGYRQVEDKQPKKPNCHFCDHLKDEYCEVLDINPCYTEKGCDYFEPRDGRIHEICEEIKKLSERMEDIEKQIKKEKEEEIEKLKAELDCTKFHRTLQWKCERCGKLIPYMSDFCHECADEILGDPPKPFDPAEMEEA